jgi:hypothetical protein
MGINTTNAEAARNMVIAGVGLGMMMQIFVLSVQNSVTRMQMGSATALTQFSRSIGATLGVALMGVIVNQRLPANVRQEGAVIHRLPDAGPGRAGARAAPRLPASRVALRGRLRHLTALGARSSPPARAG